MSQKQRENGWKAVLAVAVLYVLVPVQWAAAGVIYTYTGNNFTTADSPYTTANFITITLELDALLPASTTYSFPELDLTTLAGFSLSMSDGVQTLTSGSALVSAQVTATDANNLPLYWNMMLGAVPNVISSSNSDFSYSGYGQFGRAYGSEGSPGTWSVVGAQVPAPGSILLLALGLLSFAAVRGRREDRF